MQKNSKIYVAGHRGLLGSAILRELRKRGYENLVFKTRSELDLLDQSKTFQFLHDEKPDYVFLSAAKVGGIVANLKAPAEFLYENLAIQNNVIDGSYKAGVDKLLFVGSSCIYPKDLYEPITEDRLLTGPLEPTNEGYALAKVAGIKMIQFYKKQYGCNFISAIPTNLYGINDNYNPESSHLLPSLIRKIHQAKIENCTFIEIWGSGKPLREFMLSDDCAEALVFLMENYSQSEPINIGTGKDLTVLELANIVADVLQVKLQYKLDSSKPDGMKRKVLDVSKLKNLGWTSRISLQEGIRIAYDDFLKRLDT